MSYTVFYTHARSLELKPLSLFWRCILETLGGKAGWGSRLRKTLNSAGLVACFCSLGRSLTCLPLTCSRSLGGTRPLENHIPLENCSFSSWIISLTYRANPNPKSRCPRWLPFSHRSWRILPGCALTAIVRSLSLLHTDTDTGKISLPPTVGPAAKISSYCSFKLGLSWFWASFELVLSWSWAGFGIGFG